MMKIIKKNFENLIDNKSYNYYFILSILNNDISSLNNKC